MKSFSPTLCACYFTAALLLALAGCTRSPGYKAPDVPTPAAWKAGQDSVVAGLAPTSQPPEAPATLQQAPAAPAWWALFNDPELATIEQQVVAQNFSLQAAAARVQEARANLRVANSYRMPLVSLDPQAYRTRLSALRPLPVTVDNGNRNLGVTQTQYYIPLNVSYELDVWGRIRSSVRAAAAEADATEAAQRAAQLLLTADAAAYYFGLRGLDTELAVLDSARQGRAQSLQLTQARFRAGVDNEISVRRAETELASVEATFIETRRQRQGFEAALATLAGQPASTFRLVPRPTPLLAPPVPATVPANLLARRPDLREAERQLAAANARIDVARLTRLPTVRLNGFIGSQSAEFNGLTKIDDSYTYYVAGVVSIPIFNGGRNRANQQVAEAQYNGLTAEYKQAALVAFQEVEIALANVQQSQQQVAAQQRALRAARQAGQLTAERYRTGLTNYFEIVDADRQSLEAARQLVQAQANQLTYTVQLVRALGGTWE